jgi:hypothetical protein
MNNLNPNFSKAFSLLDIKSKETNKGVCLEGGWDNNKLLNGNVKNIKEYLEQF